MTWLSKWWEKNPERISLVSLHTLAWLIYLAFFALVGATSRPEFRPIHRFWYVLSVAITDLPLFYLFYSLAVPKLLANKRGWVFTGFLILILAIYPFLRYGLDHLFVYLVEGYFSPFLGQLTAQNWVVYLLRVFAGFFVVFMAGVGKFTFDWFKNERIKRELENQNLTSELAFLKSQINPHFLFNTLNNIHTLAYKKQDGAAESIMKLSELMRYMLYESDTDKVPLDIEVQHLKSFIGLQALRFKVENIVKLDIKGDTSRKTIAPLILLPFVENAFKHGHNLKLAGAIEVGVEVKEYIRFWVINEKRPENEEVSKDEVGGIGLENISRRLELIYKEHYTLTIDDTSTHFKINLILRK